MPLHLLSGAKSVEVMEGLEVEDISPALEATEDYLHCLDSGQEDGQVRPPKLKEVSTLDKLTTQCWGKLRFVLLALKCAAHMCLYYLSIRSAWHC